jgi:hypothetical protein
MNKSQSRLLFDGDVSQLQPPPPEPLSSSPASLPASAIFGTHACAVHVSFVLHCASVLHATHLPLGTSHASDEPASTPASPPPQSASVAQPRHVCVDVSQIGLLAFAQSAFAAHSTHVYVASSHAGVAPVHATLYFDVHVTHSPCFVPPSAHALVQACPLSNALHGLHAGGIKMPSQIGISATQPCA